MTASEDRADSQNVALREKKKVSVVLTLNVLVQSDRSVLRLIVLTSNSIGNVYRTFDYETKAVNINQAFRVVHLLKSS